jgi:ELWxxDGT repeat protein
MSISRIVFASRDASGNANLWVTTRTPAGTSEPTVAGANAAGLFDSKHFPPPFSPGFTVLGNRAVFQGYSANGVDSLWVTDGTSAGTGGLSVAGANANGLFTNVIAPHLTVFAGKALFVGAGASGNISLWTTDGTGAGTSQLAAAGSYTNGLFYNFATPDFTVLGGKALFAGQDASGNPNLWVTDGTSAGTSELAVAGANSGGLFSLNFFPSGFSPGFTVLGTRALFEGYDASGIDGLWVTDGTSAGTGELTVAGSLADGLFFDVNTPDLTVLAGKAVFVGEDASGDISLWTTDATGAGTRELTVAGSYARGLFFNVAEPDFTVLGNKVLFAGQDATGKSNLWVTDGTAGGTSELAVAGANAGGLFDLNYFSAGFSPGFTVLGNMALFEGYDANGVDSLWVTDGTAAGTRELSVSDSYANGLFAKVSAPDITVIGGTALFAGKDASGKINLWVTDGTSAGTSELTAAGASSSGLSPNDFVGLPTSAGGPASDFNADGKSDLLWQNSSGEVVIWELNGTSVLRSASLGNPGPSWHVKATGDFNGDGFSDILWQNDDGSVAIWEMNGINMIGGAVLGNPGPSWHVVGTGDFNGDGFSDILWQNGSGEVAVWEMNGTSLIGAASLGNPGPDWHVIGSGDFNGDGFSDILWQKSSGEVDICELNGTKVIANGSLGNPGPTWHAVSTGDFNGDGHSDILWQNDSGEVAVWEMNGTAVIAAASLGNPGPSWHVIGTGDYNVDGHSDIRFQNSSGEVAIWELNGANVTASGSLGNPGPMRHVTGDSSPYAAARADLPWQRDGTDTLLQNDTGEAFLWASNGSAVTGSGSLGNPGPSWHIKASGDFNGDGNPDLLWQNDDGTAAIWETNGSGVVASGIIGNPGPSWHAMSVGDFNHDGRSDILWQNDDGSVAIWEMNGTNMIGGAIVGNPGPSWHVKGTGDFNGDGFSDVLWQNDDGSVAIWEMNGANTIGAGVVGNPGPSWHALGTGDFNGDGRADILWQNDSGEAAIWEMNGTNVIATASLGNPGPDWHIVGVGDYNNDGKSDILWQNSSGAVAVWEMNGTNAIATTIIANPGPTWHA